MHFVAIKTPEQMDLLAVRRVALAHPHASLVELSGRARSGAGLLVNTSV
jgi:hypothetical protein